MTTFPSRKTIEVDSIIYELESYSVRQTVQTIDASTGDGHIRSIPVRTLYEIELRTFIESCWMEMCARIGREFAFKLSEGNRHLEATGVVINVSRQMEVLGRNEGRIQIQASQMKYVDNTPTAQLSLSSREETIEMEELESSVTVPAVLDREVEID